MTTKDVDDIALSDPPSSRPELRRSYSAPDSAAERRTGRVRQQVLTLDRVGVHGDFFDSGGNAVRLPAVLAALQKHPEYPDLITLTDPFRHTTRGSDRRAALHKLRSKKGTTR